MAAINKIAGEAFIKVDGDQLALRGSITANLKQFEREGVAGLDGIHGFKQTPFIPFVEVEIGHTQGLDLNQLARIDDATVQVELANGWVGLLRQAWTNPGDVNPEEGALTVRFEGKSGEWIRNG